MMAARFDAATARIAAGSAQFAGTLKSPGETVGQLPWMGGHRAAEVADVGGELGCRGACVLGHLGQLLVQQVQRESLQAVGHGVGPQRDRHVVAVEAVQTADDLVGLEAMTFQTGGSCAHVQVSLRYPAEMLGMLMRPLLVSMSFRMLAILGTASIRAMPGRGTAGLLPVFFLGSWSPAAIVSVYADRHT